MTTTGNSIIGVGMQAAASVIIFVPNLIIFIFMQSKVIRIVFSDEKIRKLGIRHRKVDAVQKGTYLPVESSKSSSAADGVLWQITVSNSAGIELPNTGGPGTWLFAMLGVLAIAAGLALLRRGHRSNR